jgi:Lon protease-like protein
MTPYRQAVIDPSGYADDFTRAFGEDEVDRDRFLKMMKDYAEFANFDLNWDEINKTGTADLVNFCCMVSPYGAKEKQVLLEAKSLGDRAETLIALAEVEMAKGSNAGVPLN